MHSTTAASRVAARLLLVALVGIVITCLRRCLADPSTLVTTIPDDSFYYLTLARNLVDTGRWTFDHGISSTSGFHPLYAYSLTPMAALFGFGFGFAKAAIAVNALLTLGSVCALARLLMRRGDCTAWLFGLALIVGTWQFAFNAATPMEWALACMLGFGLWSCLLLGAGSNAVLFGIALCLPLGRLELGATPLGLLALAAAWNALGRRLSLVGGETLPLRRYLTAAVGSLVGMLAVVLHNAWAAGSYLPTSAATKLAWAAAEPAARRMAAVAMLLGDGCSPLRLGHGWATSSGFKIAVMVAAATLSAISAYAVQRRVDPMIRAGDGEIPHARFAALSSVLCLLGYTLLYARGTALDLWYSAAFLPPAWVLVSLSLRGVLGSPRTRRAATWLALAFLGAHALRANTTTLRVAQRSLLAGSIAAGSQLGPGSRMGAFNAGLVGFVQQGTVVNLDGLVNQDLLADTWTGRRECYLHEIALTHVLEFPLIRASVPGYERAFDAGAFRPLQRTHATEDPEQDAVLYELDRGVLSRLCAPELGY